MTPPVNPPRRPRDATRDVQAHRTDALFRRLARFLPQS